jgi:hypothetical protein
MQQQQQHKRVTWAPGPLKEDGGPRPVKKRKSIAVHPLPPSSSFPRQIAEVNEEEKNNNYSFPFEIPPTPKGLEHLISD